MDNFLGAKKLENKELNWGEVVDFFSKKYILTRASFQIALQVLMVM